MARLWVTHLEAARRGAVGVVTANVRELVFCVGLGLVAGGLALVSIPAALIVPGVVLVWLAIPPREKST
jgi:hypothetical protein